jgi:hypothetical protein
LRRKDGRDTRPEEMMDQNAVAQDKDQPVSQVPEHRLASRLPIPQHCSRRFRRWGPGGGVPLGHHGQNNCAGKRGADAGALTSRSLLLYMLQRMEAPSTASPPAHSRAAFFSAQKHQLKSISSKASAQKHQLESISSKASARKQTRALQDFSVPVVSVIVSEPGGSRCLVGREDSGERVVGGIRR